MPKVLADRLTVDSISQFRIAARIRSEDAWQLAAAGRSAAAIYLWGYTAEMTLKAAWFRLLGYPENRAISFRDLEAARTLATARYGIAWPGRNFHAVVHWAELLLQHRIALGRSYPDPRFGRTLIEHSQSVYERWRETLRYKKNRAYSFEVATVGASAQWLLHNSDRL